MPHLEKVSTLPIADYALLSDCRSAALVSRGGSVDWPCFPRFGGPAVFARLLDQSAGHWLIHPVEDAEISRRYLDNTLVLDGCADPATAERHDPGLAELVSAPPGV